MTTETFVLARDVFGWQQPVTTKTLNTPPGSPTNGDRYLIGSSPTGAWASHALHIATYSALTYDPVTSLPLTYGWVFAVPTNGWFVYVLDENLRYRFNGTAWVSDGSVGEANTGSNANTAGVGVFYQKSGVDLQFKGIKAGSTKVTATDSTSDHTVAVDVVPGQIDHNALLNYLASNHANVVYDSTAKVVVITTA